jgi:hypothetical protein
MLQLFGFRTPTVSFSDVPIHVHACARDAKIPHTEYQNYTINDSAYAHKFYLWQVISQDTFTASKNG